LREALISLIHEKNYDSITIQEIVDRADVGRSTFYNHFYDKDSLLFSGFTEFVEAIHHEQSSDKEELSLRPYRIPSLFIFEHAGGNMALYKALLGSNGIVVFIRKLETLLSKIVMRQLANSKHYAADKTVVKFLPYHVGKTFTATLSWWLDNNIPCSAEEINRIYEGLLVQGLESYSEKN
jgi:AcrR family transcriptional regulator